MKWLYLLFLYVPVQINAQNVLNFNKRFVESEDKWVVIRTDKDSIMNYGFIYIDASAGLTLNYEGSFTISKNGVFIPKKLDSIGIKYRLEPNNVKVAFIPSEKYEELKITEFPYWLKFYKSDTTSIEHLYRWGFLYNSYNECAKALTYLENAQKINPKFKGLEVELAFSYNCLQQFEKAVVVLQDAIKTSPNECYFYKELIYAQLKLSKFDNADETGKKAILSCKDNLMKSEICYNITHELYLKRDKEKFKFWVEEAKKSNASNPQLMDSLKTMESEINK